MPENNSNTNGIRFGAGKVLVYINGDETCERAIDIARRRAAAEGSILMGVTVQSPYLNALSTAQRRQLQKNIELAKEAGAPVESLVGTDPVFLLSEYCAANQITTLVMTRPVKKTFFDKIRPSLSRKLVESLPGLTFILIPGGSFAIRQRVDLEEFKLTTLFKNIGVIALSLTAATLVCMLLERQSLNDTVLAPIYILAVLVIAIHTNKWYWPAISSLIAVACFNFFFTEPRFSFNYQQSGLTLLFVITLLISLIAGFIGQRLHLQSEIAKRTTWRDTILLNASTIMEHNRDPKALTAALNEKIAELCETDVVFYPIRGDLPLDPIFYRSPIKPTIAASEAMDARDAARFAARTGMEAGAGTGNYPHCPLYLIPWQGENTVYGVSAIDVRRHPLDESEQMILRSIVAEGSYGIDSRLKEQEYQKMVQDAENAKMRSRLIKAISHDIRTPLTSIIASVDNLRQSDGTLDAPARQVIYDALSSDAMHLHYMISNLLMVSRLEGGMNSMHQSPELMEDVVQAGLQEPAKSLRTHTLDVHIENDFLMASMDGAMISLVISNMVMNGLEHTPPGTPITVEVFKRDDQVFVEVRDEGHGISDEMKPRIFDVFYTGEQKVIDSNHFLGIGLYLCKAIIQAHGGEIYVHDNEPKGAVFGFSLPLIDLNSFA